VTTLTIRGIDDDTKARLRVRAAHHGRSMEAEVRAILRDAVASAPRVSGRLGSRIHARFAGIDGSGVSAPGRSEAPRAAEFER